MDIANRFRDNLMVEDRYRMILDGLQVTLLITLFAALLGTLLGELVTLLKGTSIVGYIAVMDMTRASDLIRSRTFDAFFPLLPRVAGTSLPVFRLNLNCSPSAVVRPRRAFCM